MTPHQFASELVHAHRTSASDEVIGEVIRRADPDVVFVGQTMRAFCEMALLAYLFGAGGVEFDRVLAPSVVRQDHP